MCRSITTPRTPARFNFRFADVLLTSNSKERFNPRLIKQGKPKIIVSAAEPLMSAYRMRVRTLATKSGHFSDAHTVNVASTSPRAREASGRPRITMKRNSGDFALS
jgi:hypothetical protein